MLGRRGVLPDVHPQRQEGEESQEDRGGDGLHREVRQADNRDDEGVRARRGHTLGHQDNLLRGVHGEPHGHKVRERRREAVLHEQGIRRGGRHGRRRQAHRRDRSAQRRPRRRRERMHHMGHARRRADNAPRLEDRSERSPPGGRDPQEGPHVRRRRPSRGRGQGPLQGQISGGRRRSRIPAIGIGACAFSPR